MPRDERDTDLDIRQGGGPPTGTAWTLDVGGDQAWSADLEHAAPVPRVGEMIELIHADGSRRRLQVREVVHVLQPSATDRPAVREEVSGPNSIMAGDSANGPPRLLRAGLPRVVAVPLGPDTGSGESTESASE